MLGVRRPPNPISGGVKQGSVWGKLFSVIYGFHRRGLVRLYASEPPRSPYRKLPKQNILPSGPKAHIFIVFCPKMVHAGTDA